MPDARTGVRPLTSADRHHFFGYYDTSPWDGTDDRFVAHAVDFTDRQPKPTDEAEVRLFGPDAPAAGSLVGSTTAWNFQQGSMLQWLGPDYDRLVYNDRVDGDLVAHVVDPDSGHERMLPTPVYACSPDGGSAMTIDFTRLQRRRPGYGYALTSEDRSTPDDPIPADDGLYAVDLASGDRRLAVSLSDLRVHEPAESMSGGAHWVNHVSYSPKGDRIAFLHRWELRDRGMYTRLLTADPDGSDLSVVLDNGKATHYGWRSNEELLAWTRPQATISRAARSGWFDLPVVSHLVNVVRSVSLPTAVRQGVMGEHFYAVDVTTGETSSVAPDRLTRDGHPTFAPGGRYVALDTYAGEDGRRELYLYDFETDNRTDLATFDSDSDLMETAQRCDLHPRWNRAGTTLAVDSLEGGTRRMYAVDVAELLK